MVTVVDASSFPALYGARGPLASRPDLGDGGGLRPVVDLLVEQLECAESARVVHSLQLYTSWHDLSTA